MSYITLQDYVNEMHCSIVEFYKFWISKHRTDPDTYPLYLDKKDRDLWGDQFAMFMANKNKEFDI